MTSVSQVVNLPGGHIGGIPVEETLLSLGPVLLLMAGAALAIARARLRRVRRRGAVTLSARRDYRVPSAAVNPARPEKNKPA